MLTCDNYISPATLDEAFDTMERHEGRYRLVAGATDILPWAREGRAGDVHIPVLIDVAGIPELNVRGPSSDGTFRLGAATRFQRLLDDVAVTSALPVMPFCAVWFADDQIRESATIGGNLVNASPAADGTPAFLVHDACLVLMRRKRTRIEWRTAPLSEFQLGPGKVGLMTNELLVEVRCKPLPGYGAAFEKVGHRRSLVISTVCVAALVQIDLAAGTFRDVRLACAGIGPVPQRMTAVEGALTGNPVDESSLVAAADMAGDLVASRTRQEYRREVVRGFVLRALVSAARRAGADDRLLSPAFEAAHG